jgi:hypothetical protein
MGQGMFGFTSGSMKMGGCISICRVLGAAHGYSDLGAIISDCGVLHRHRCIHNQKDNLLRT